MAINIVEQCSVAPWWSGTAIELMLPLLDSDMVYLSMSVPENLVMYEFQCSESHFFDTILPKLKNSLSLTLKHFSPLAGKIIFPLTSSGGMPVSQYVAGDSVSMTVAVSKADLIPLTGNLSRDADQFHDYVARLPPATYSSDFIKFSVFAVQVTLFPNQGICIGITNHHSICDGSTVVRFFQTWASINKLNDEATSLSGQQHQEHCLSSSYDRSCIPDAASLATSYWDRIKILPPIVSGVDSPLRNRNLATFIVTEEKIIKLKNLVNNYKRQAYLSSFVVVCAHLWTCFARSAAEAGEGAAPDDDEMEYLICVVDYRGWLNPSLPENYFGNCLALVLAECTHGKLKGDKGVAFAAEAIGEAIQKALKHEKGIMRGSMELSVELERVLMNGNRWVTIAGSPRFDIYSADFGWGGPKKLQLVQANSGGSVCLCKSREFEGGVEIGLSMEKAKVDAFAHVFNLQQPTHDHFSKL